MKRILMRSGLIAAGLITLATVVQAADAPKVLNVVAVKVKAGQQDAYLQKVKQLNGISGRLETGATMRVWRAQIAGDETGTIYVGMEYANTEAWATGTAKTAADAEWQKLVRELDTSGMRELLGTSLLVEVTP